jgi:peptide/nickel transport system substrate-binding protein
MTSHALKGGIEMKKEPVCKSKKNSGAASSSTGYVGNEMIVETKATGCSRRAFLKLAGAGVTAAYLGGLAGSLIPAEAGEAGPPVFGGTLKIGINADVVGLDPHVATAQSSHVVLHHVCDSLLAIDASVTPKANLAERWEILDDGMRYRFYLKQGVTFHNGKKMTASDVKYSLERAAKPEIAPVAASHLKDMDSVTTLDDYSVEVKMKQRFAPFLNVLANELMGPYIIPEGEGEKQGGKITSPVGTGPYEFVEYKPDQYVLLRKYKDYKAVNDDKPSMFYGKKVAYLDELRFMPITEDSVRVDALTVGDVDFCYYVPGKDIARLKNAQNVVVHRSPGYQFSTINFNCSAAPLNNKKLRQAIAYAVNKNEIVEVAQDGFAVPGTDPIPPGHRWRTPTLDQTADFNLEKAKQLLQESGYAGESLVMKSTRQYRFMDKTAEMVQIQLQKIGVGLKVQYLDWGTMLSDFIQGNYQCVAFGYTAKQDPNTVASENYWSKGLNLNRYGHPQLDELVEEGMHTLDFEKRKQIYDQIHMITLGPDGDFPMIVTMHNDVLDATGAKLKGYAAGPMNFPVFYNVWLEK